MQAEQQIINMLTEVLKIAKHMVKHPQQPVSKKQPKKAATGIYPHQSKYNPWRAYVWDKTKKQTIYLGAFPSINKAKLAQKAFRAGRPIIEGTRPQLRVVGG